MSEIKLIQEKIDRIIKNAITTQMVITTDEDIYNVSKNIRKKLFDNNINLVEKYMIKLSRSPEEIVLEILNSTRMETFEKDKIAEYIIDELQGQYDIQLR